MSLERTPRFVELTKQITRLRIVVVEESRDEHDINDDRADAKAFIARAQLDAALNEFFDLVQASAS